MTPLGGLATRDPFFDELLRQVHLDAGADTPTISVDLVIAGHRIRLTVLGAAMADLIAPALGWAIQPTTRTADAHITVASGGRLRMQDWASEHVGTTNVGATLPDQRHIGTFDAERHIVNVFDTVTRNGLFWCSDPDTLPEWEQGGPLRNLISWALQPNDIHLVHAACVGASATGGGSGGVLIAGRGGSGKSTSTLACLNAGMLTAGDDYCAVSRAGTSTNPFVAHAVFGVAKVSPSSPAAADLDLSRASPPRSDGKVHLSIVDSLTPSLPLVAIVLPTVGERTGTAQAIGARQAMLGLAPSSVLQSVYGGREVLAAAAALTRAVPAYSLQVGPDLDRVVAEIRSLLDS